MPVYRRVRKTNWWSGEEIIFELAGPQWKRADARAVTEWFEAQSRRYTNDNLHGGQLRRIIRLLKDFANSRPSWRERTATGFMITVLAAKSFTPHPERDDISLRETMQAIASSFWFSYSVPHPVLQGESITRNGEDARPRVFVEQLRDGLKVLDRLPTSGDRDLILAIWDDLFHTDYFTRSFSSEPTTA